jgi:hypothetical protein
LGIGYIREIKAIAADFFLTFFEYYFSNCHKLRPPEAKLIAFNTINFQDMASHNEAINLVWVRRLLPATVKDLRLKVFLEFIGY